MSRDTRCWVRPACLIDGHLLPLTLGQPFRSSRSNWASAWRPSYLFSSPFLPVRAALQFVPAAHRHTIAYTMDQVSELGRTYRAFSYPDLCERAWGKPGAVLAAILLLLNSWYVAVVFFSFLLFSHLLALDRLLLSSTSTFFSLFLSLFVSFCFPPASPPPPRSFFFSFFPCQENEN